MSDGILHQIEQEIGVISEGKGGWKTKLNLVSWGGRPAKYETRAWSPANEKMGEGITLTKEELINLK